MPVRKSQKQLESGRFWILIVLAGSVKVCIIRESPIMRSSYVGVLGRRKPYTVNVDRADTIADPGANTLRGATAFLGTLLGNRGDN